MTKQIYDLLLCHDPGSIGTYRAGSSTFRRVDIAIRNGKIVRMAEGIDQAKARQIRYIPQGAFIAGCLIDPHVHYGPGCSFADGMQPEQHSLYAGTPVVVDAGSRGHLSFNDFRRYLIDRADDGRPCVRMLAFLNIAADGLSRLHHECQSLEYLQVEPAIEMIKGNTDVIVGVKVRLAWLQTSRELWKEALARARKVARACELPLMVHIHDGPDLAEILRELERGDIITHCWHGAGRKTLAGVLSVEGKLRKCVKRALRKGVYFDLGHGGGGYDHSVARACILEMMSQSEKHITLSTDLHSHCVHGPTYDFPTTISKTLCIDGVELTDVLRMSTSNTARMLGLPRNEGDLSVGSPADLTVLLLSESERGYPLVDATTKSWTVSQRLQKLWVVRDGIVI